MGAIAEAAAGIVGGLFDGAKSIYDIWSNQRDFDYQKSLQNDIFNREDTAVQRRMADLKAAGLNPNLAAGSAAGAGAVVGRSNTPSISGNPVGTGLDMAQHVQQLRAQRTENQILKNQERESAAKAKQEENAALLNQLDFLNLLGINSNLNYDPKTHEYSVSGDINFGKNDFGIITPLGKGNTYYSKELNAANARLIQYLNWQYQNNQNSAAMLQKDNEFYVGDKIAEYLGTGARIFSGFGSGAVNFGKYKYYR